MIRTSALLIAFASLVFGETQSGSVSSAGKPIPGATVTATCGSDKITTVTDDAGRYEMGGLPSTPCRFSVAMFGFDATPRETAASATPVNFDLSLQRRASLPSDTDQAGGRGRGGFRQRPATADAGTAQTPGGGPGRGGFGRQGGGFGPGRGGFGQAQGQGRGAAPGGQGSPAAQAGNAPNQNQGFQNLSLVQNGDNPLQTESADIVGGADASGANEAFLVNGTLSEGVVAQRNDNFGLGPGGFGPAAFIAGGPGGPGFDQQGNFGSGDPAAGGNDGGGPGGPGGGGPGGGFGGGGGRGGGGRGGFGGGGRGGGRGGRGGPPNRQVQFGNRVNRGRRQQFQGNAYYTIGNSALNARPYSFTSPTSLSGQVVPKAAYANNRFGFSGGGPLSIPHLFSSDKTFWFVNYTGVRSKNGFDRVSTVPTAAERSGDFSALGVNIKDPFTSAVYPGGVIPTSLLNPTALALLKYVPLPNSPGIRNNFQLIGANPSNNDNLQVRINQTISAKDGLDVNFSYQHRNAQNIQAFGFVDPTHGYGLSSSLTYRHTFSRNFINSASWSFSRNLTQTLSSFSYGANIEADLGISGVSPTPAFYGPPTLGFTNFSSLSDASPSLNRSQTSGVTEQMIQIHGKQTLTYGFGLQRRQNNTLTDSNARGSFSFTGLGTGYDLADFLLSFPYQTSVVNYANGNYARYLRETTLNAFVTDDYRVRSNLTLNFGLRWEYFGPFTEKNNQLSNLDVSPYFNAVKQVLPGQTGPYSGDFPSGMIRPDYKLFSPRIGTAWKPFKNRQLVIRSGYGIYFNGGVYGTLASRLVGQPPYAVTTQIFQSAANPLSLQNGFPQLQSDLIANTFAVDPNYTPGYSQNWTTSIQQTFARTYVVEVGYNGIKGTHLDVLQLPNRSPLGTPQLQVQNSLLIPNTGQFSYDQSVGNSTYNAIYVRLNRRLARGASYQLQYTFSKAIDDSSTLGGGPVLIPYNISAERALSPTDQRHNLRVNINYQSPIRNNRTGKVANLLRGWTIASTLTATSGTPFTATVTGDPSGTGYTGNARAEATGLPVTGGTGYFNPAAFTIPLTGTFGNAARDTIPGIANFSLNASFFRSFRVDEKRRIEFRVDSTNPINHVNVTQINTTVNSIQYGLPVGAGAMRSVTATVRLRF